jgi:FtsZ-interacting cell division protein ZipA
MSTTEIIWIIVIAVAALVLIGLVVFAMRRKSVGVADNREKAARLRQQADIEAAVLPDAQARADQAAAEAERARLEAERVEAQAAAARTDPDVNHRAPDYSPDVVDPAGPSAVPAEPTDTTPRDETVVNDTRSMRHRLEGDTPQESDVHPEGTGGTHRT